VNWRSVGGAGGCSHLGDIAAVFPRTPAGCEECLEADGVWTGLTLCRTCGYVGCSGDSPGRHARRHYERVDHPVITAYRSVDTWGWCYEDEVLLVPALRR
jgi:uncharacterized UBP type Zn finger protein